MINIIPNKNTSPIKSAIFKNINELTSISFGHLNQNFYDYKISAKQYKKIYTKLNSLITWKEIISTHYHVYYHQDIILSVKDDTRYQECYKLNKKILDNVSTDKYTIRLYDNCKEFVNIIEFPSSYDYHNEHIRYTISFINETYNVNLVKEDDYYYITIDINQKNVEYFDVLDIILDSL